MPFKHDLGSETSAATPSPLFDRFFHTATGLPAPYDYQRRLAGGDTGAPCESRLIQIPTGLGKTAAVVMAWLWNRAGLVTTSADTCWPRRLVYCLPMRTLVEQTEGAVRGWLTALGLLWDGNTGSRAGQVGVHVLMGGEAPGEWDLYPEEYSILIGTQDMLLSRALNRGYGMSRYRWPMHFGLLNSDCLWVLDETQLMGVGLETSAQLAGFRAGFGTTRPTVCWWMSATLDDSRLATVDHPKPAEGWPVATLSEAEKSGGQPRRLLTAPKKLTRAPLALSSATAGSYAKQLAGLIKERHQPGTLTLVVLNRVSRSRDTFEALAGGKKPLYAPEQVALIHSRFRPIDRERHTQLLFGDGDRIVIATQAVEAGVDVSARLLITELAPWSSLVQRLGRSNRRADFPDAEVMWVDIEPDAKGELTLPYTPEELDVARAALIPLADASPQTLREVAVTEKPAVRPVIRRRDLVDLFDTTPDLCGQDLDVSRYIRDGDDSDVQFYWRALPADLPDVNEPAPQRAELCRVAIGSARDFLKKKSSRAWRWNSLDEVWETAGNPRPGAIYLVDAASGGYHDHRGWTGDPKDKPTPHPPTGTAEPDGYRRDPDAGSRAWQSIDEHTRLVIAATDRLSAELSPDDRATLHTAALWHDVGKAHAEFQKSLRNGPDQPEDPNILYAKSRNPPQPFRSGTSARSLRHELASALAWLLVGPRDQPERDLIAYLIAAHHGKVRLSIRSLPNEPGDPQDPDRLFARGNWDGDRLPAVSLGEITTPPVTLDLSFMKMGDGPHGPSWLARTVALRDRLGPFRLAYLETLLRAADARASIPER